MPVLDLGGLIGPINSCMHLNGYPGGPELYEPISSVRTCPDVMLYETR